VCFRRAAVAEGIAQDVAKSFVDRLHTVASGGRP